MGSELSSRVYFALAWILTSLLPGVVGLGCILAVLLLDPKSWWVALTIGGIICVKVFSDTNLLRTFSYSVVINHSQLIAKRGKTVWSFCVDGSENVELKNRLNLYYIEIIFTDGSLIRFIPKLGEFYAIKQIHAKEWWVRKMIQA